MNTLDRTQAPEIKHFDKLSIPQPRLSSLDNGLPLTISDHGSDDVTRLSILWQGGIAEVPYPELAALTSLTMREGTTSKSGAEIAEAIEYNGALLAIAPSSHYTRLDLRVTNSRLEHVLPTIVDIFRHPSFPEHELRTLSETQARAIEIERKKVSHIASTELSRLYMGEGHPLSIAYDPERFRSVTRDEILSYWSRTFDAPPAHIYLAGHITPEVEAAINRHIGQLSFSNAPTPLRIIPFAPQKRQQAIITQPQAKQCAVHFAIPTIGRDHPDYTSLRLLVMAIGGYFGSRLMLVLREKLGLTYGVQAHLLGYREGSVMTIETECDNRYVGQIITNTNREIERIRFEDFTEEEVERLRFNAMSQLASMLDTPFSISDYYRNHLLAGTPLDYFYAQQEAAMNITPESLARLARHIPLSKIYTVIVGNPT